MADRPTWTGAVIFAGFPIYLRAFPLVQSRAAGSFKSLCPCHHLPIKQHKVCADTGEVVDNADLLKGVETAKDQYAVLDPDAVEFIRSSESSDTVEVERFAPRDSLPLTYALGRYRLVPNDEDARLGGPGRHLLERADGDGTCGCSPGLRPALRLARPARGDRRRRLRARPPHPAVPERARTPPEWAPEANEQAGDDVRAVRRAGGLHDGRLLVAAYESQLRGAAQRGDREGAQGRDRHRDRGADAAPAVPDLMAAMQAALASAPKKPAAKKPRAKAKAA
jgi:hypothetical protein